MFRAIVLGSVVLALCHDVNADEVRSYHARGDVVPGEGLVVIESVPAGGLVLTDIVYPNTGSVHFVDVTVDGVSVFAAEFLSGEQHYALRSGIPIPAGAVVKITNVSLAIDRPVTLSGYIPGPSPGTVPAIPTWGIVLMGLLMVTAGSLVYLGRERRQPVS